MANKKLSRVDVLCLVVGSIIGWGSFTLPGNKFLPESGVINTILGLIIGGVSVLFIQRGYHFMLIHQTDEDGGEFSYTYNHFGKKHGFIVGWGLVLCYLSIVPLNATAFVLVFRILFKDVMNFFYLYSIVGYKIYLSDIIIASLILIIFAAINIKGVKVSAYVQNGLIFLLVFGVIALFFIMLTKVDLAQFKLTYITGDKLELHRIAPVVAIVPFLFVGFDVIDQVVTDLGFSSKRASAIAIIGIFTGVLMYALLNTMTGLAYSPAQASSKEWALGEAILSHIGLLGFIVLIIALFAAVTSGINGFLLSSAKLLGALATYGMIPAKYKEKNEHGVHAKSIIFVTIISMIAPWFGREVIGYIVDMSSLLAALAYLYVCIVSLRYCKTKTDKIFVTMGIVMSSCFILLLVVPASPAFLSKPSIVFMLLWVILGLFYYLHKKDNLITKAIK